MRQENPAILEPLQGRVIVSCQAYPGEPLRFPEAMAAMADSAVMGGAAGIRAQGLDDIRLVRSRVDVPLIGLLKRGTAGVFITPTVADVTAVLDAGADIVAADATTRPRPDGAPFAASVHAAHERGALLMADCGCLDDAHAAADAGADIVGTTLAGYTGTRPRTDGPDLDLIADITRHVDVPVIAEGRIGTPDQARACIDAGAYAVVVGTAITHPTSITTTFVNHLALG